MNQYFVHLSNHIIASEENRGYEGLKAEKWIVKVVKGRWNKKESGKLKQGDGEQREEEEEWEPEALS